MNCKRLLGCIAATLTAVATAGVFGEPASDAIIMTSPLRVLDAPGRTDNAAVRLSLDLELYSAIRDHGRVTVTDFITAPRERGMRSEVVTLDLERMDVVTRTTRFVLGHVDGPDRPLPHPDVVMFRGSVRGEAGSRVFLSLSPHGTRGYLRIGHMTQVISSGPAGENRDLLIYNLRALPAGAIHWQDFICRTEGDIAVVPQRAVVGDAPCRQVTVAIETDAEFTDDLFGGSTDDSGAYVATLIGATSEIFSNQVNAQFSIGFVRLWQGEDIWTATNTTAQLFQFRDEWNANMTHVHRHLAHYLSGRSLGGGVAWLDAVCHEELGYALSANLNGFFPYPIQHHHEQNWDPFVVAHEFGHNFGAPHTHSYCPPLDQCAPPSFHGQCQNQTVCISEGTIMSYCHTCDGGMTNIVLEFHPVVVDTILAYLDTVTGCNLACGVAQIEVIAATGDPVPNGLVIDLLQPPFTNGLGQVGFTGGLSDGDRFVWFDNGIVWRNSMAQQYILSGSTATMGISDAGQWMYNPSVSGDDGIWTNEGLLLKRGDASPTEPAQFVTFTSRLQMLPDATKYFISGLNPVQGSTNTIERIMYRVDVDGAFSKVFKSGDFVAGGIQIRAPNGVGFDYQISDNEKHHIHRLQAVGQAPFDFVYVDDTVAAFRGEDAGDDTEWDLFRAVSINNTGNYVFSGSTTGGPPEHRNFIAANGEIVIRSGDTVGGVAIADGAAISAASINNLDEVAFIWAWGTFDEPEGTLFIGPVGSLTSSQPILSVGDVLDLTGDGIGDTVLTRFNATTLTGPAVNLSDHPWVFVNVDLKPLMREDEEYTAIIQVYLDDPPPPTCPGDCNEDGVVDVSDLLILLGAWSRSGPCDLNGDGVVDVSDLLILLGAWGPCP